MDRVRPLLWLQSNLVQSMHLAATGPYMRGEWCIAYQDARVWCKSGSLNIWIGLTLGSQSNLVKSMHLDYCLNNYVINFFPNLYLIRFFLEDPWSLERLISQRCLCNILVRLYKHTCLYKQLMGSNPLCFWARTKIHRQFLMLLIQFSNHKHRIKWSM